MTTSIDREKLPGLEDRHFALLEEEIPRFSDQELARRRDALATLMEEKGVDHVLIYGAMRAGSAVQYFTEWPVTTEAACVHTPGDQDVMFIHYFNHIPLAERIARKAKIDHAGDDTMAQVIGELKKRGAEKGRIGIMGPLGFQAHQALSDAFGPPVNLGKDYVRMRLIKSAEEIDWLRIGAALSDASIAAIQDQLEPGMSERELADIVERAYVPLGGTTVIHFFGITNMEKPDQYIPQQFTTRRTVGKGDVVFTEISAAFWTHSGQVLRTFCVGAEPTELYQDLYETAESAFDAVCDVLKEGAAPQEVVDAAGLIEDAGYTTCDDLVHGYGGGYFPPILASKSRAPRSNDGPLPDMTLKAGMTVVVQPNVIDLERNAGVQVGELVHITENGAESLHSAPRGFFRIG